MSAPSLTPIGTHPTPSSENPSLPGSEHLCHAKAFEEHIHRHAEAVLMIVNDTLNKVGTGCLIGGDLLITNHHVISSPEEAEQSKAKLWYLDQAASDNSTGSIKWQNLDFDPSAYFFTCENNISEGSLQSAAPDKLDFTIVALKHASYLAQVQNACLPLFSGAVQRPSGSVCVIHHPSQVDAETQIKGARQRSLGSIQKIESCTLYYDASATDGSSGSPVIDRNGNFIGLHHQGGKNCPCTFDHSHSFAVLITKIAKHLEMSGEKVKIKKHIDNMHFLNPSPIYSPNDQIFDVPAPPPRFTGREDELKVLDELCKNNSRVAVTGLGGIGKTSLALKYAEKHRDDYKIVFCVDASNAYEVEQGLLKFAKQMKFEDSNPQNRLKKLKEALAMHASYLLILDGLDDKATFNHIEALIPSQGKCVIFTTRNPLSSKHQIGCECLRLEGFKDKEAIDFIKKTLKYSQNIEDLVIEDLARALCYLPLALKHACAYIEQQGASITTFLDKFKKEQTKLFEKGIEKPKDEPTIWTTWNMSMSQMSPETRMLFNCCSFLAPLDIPQSLLKKLFAVYQPHIITRVLRWLIRFPIPDVGKAIEELGRYSMLESLQPELYQVHGLVQQVIRNRLTDLQEHNFYLEKTVEVFTDIAKDYKYEKTDSWQVLHSVVPHLKACLDHVYEIKKAIEDKELLKSVSDLEDILGAYFYYSAYNFLSAKQHYERALQYRRESLGSEDCDVANSLNNLGELLRDQGEYEEAAALLQKALTIYKNRLGNEHSFVATALNNLGMALRGQGKYEEALSCLIESLELREKCSDNNPQVEQLAVSLNNLGLVLKDQGNYDDSHTFLSQALKLEKTIFKGEQNPFLATTLNDLGDLLRDQGKHGEAVSCLREALAIRKEIFGITSREVALSLNSLGLALREQGNCEEALSCLSESLKLNKALLGDRHVRTIDTEKRLQDLEQTLLAKN